MRSKIDVLFHDCTVIIFQWNASTHSLITDKFQLESVNIYKAANYEPKIKIGLRKQM